MYIEENEKRGSELSLDQQQAALARFVHRFTGTHKPAWACKPMPNGNAYPVQFANDSDWLANTVFAVTKSGKLDGRSIYCRSYPTWPENPELRK